MKFGIIINFPKAYGNSTRGRLIVQYIMYNVVNVFILQLDYQIRNAYTVKLYSACFMTYPFRSYLRCSQRHNHTSTR